MVSENIQLPHKLTLNERKSLTMTGVAEVVSFDEACVVLHTVLGTLEVHGQELKLKTLSIDGGQITVHGKIDNLSYEEAKKTGSFLKRLLR